MEKQTQYQFPNKGKRFFHLIFDELLCMGITVAVFKSLQINLEQNDISQIDIKNTLISYGISFMFYTFFELIFKKTPAKFITRTHVVSDDGSTPSILQIATRSLCRLIPLEEISFLFNEYQGWHDRFSNTVVVEDEISEKIEY